MLSGFYKIKEISIVILLVTKLAWLLKGFSQQPGTDFDEIFLPVVRYDSLRLLIALAISHGSLNSLIFIKHSFMNKEEILHAIA